MKSISLQMTISKKSTHYYSLLLLILVSAGLWSCSTLQRDPRSGYGFFEQDLPQANDFYEQKKAYEIDETLQDMGLGQGFYLTDGERSALATRIELKNLEKKIPTRGEKKQYYQYKGLMRSDGERIAFLSLPSTEIRAQWAKNRGYLVNEESFSEEQKLLIEKNDITLGMNQKA
ncbi:MAG: hypothetical protein K1X29_10960, partial [Bdellovibrionales bacterium]|nr:hypothetical protein [Bdellovibrionales bacterium]